MASILLHLGPNIPCCAGKISLENESISLHHLYATLNIKLNACSTSQGRGLETAHHLQTSDMASSFLHHQHFGTVLIGTNYLQVCSWATGLLMGQRLCLPAREDSGWAARLPASAHLPTSAGPSSLALSGAHLTFAWKNEGTRAACVLDGLLPLRTIFLHQQLEGREETVGGFFSSNKFGVVEAPRV